MSRIIQTLTVLVALSVGFQNAYGALNFSFTGNFVQDDDVQLFSFNVGALSTVTMRTWSYAGGTNAAGTVIARGGFDPILSLFDSTGLLIGANDDGGFPLVAADALTGARWDTYFSASLAPGSYSVSISQYDNFANGPNLSDGYSRDGQGNFTPVLTGQSGPFRDVSGGVGSLRDGHWAFDILNVEQASVSEVPEPTSMVIWGIGSIGCAWGAYRRRRQV